MKFNLYFVKTISILFFLIICNEAFVFAQSPSLTDTVPYRTLWNVGPNKQLYLTTNGEVQYYWERTTSTGSEYLGSPKGSGSTQFTIFIDFPEEGTYRIWLYPIGAHPFTSVTFGGNYPYRDNLLRVEQWGKIQWTSFESAYQACKNLSFIGVTDIPNLENVGSMAYAFALTEIEDIPHIRGWQTGHATSMRSMFHNARKFNGDVSNWNVMNVTDMRSMFEGDSSFNRSIRGWDVRKVTNMTSMFAGAVNFNSDLDAWDVDNVTDMTSMFQGALSFNGNIVGWRVKNVKKMRAMFLRANSFNRNISSWDVSSVEDMELMFDNAHSFNQDLGKWHLKSLEGGKITFDRSGMSCENYTNTLKGWARQSNVPSNITVSAAYLGYSNNPVFLIDRERLLYRYNWVISGDSPGACNVSIASDDFITVWNTQYYDNNDKTVTLPVRGRYLAVWEEVSNPANSGNTEVISGRLTLTFPHPGTYRVYLRAQFMPGDSTLNRVNFSEINDAAKLIRLENWGNVPWTSFENAFAGCFLMKVTAMDLPNLNFVTSMNSAFSGTGFDSIPRFNEWDVSRVTDMGNMFIYNSKFNQNINGWDVGMVENMEGMFRYADRFNQPLNDWDVSSVKNMSSMFESASAFNQDISSWDVGNVTNMESMFNSAESFNQPLDTWDVRSVTNMAFMFLYAENFNQDLNSWDVGMVEDMSSMFNQAFSFNGAVGNWDVGSVIKMPYLFSNATSFNQPVGSWDMRNVEDITGLFNNAESFNQPLNDWKINSVTSLESLFRYASSFNQPINSWDVSNVSSFKLFIEYASSFNQSLADWDLSGIEIDPDSSRFDISFSGTALDCITYSETLKGWAANPNTPDGVKLDATGLGYSGDDDVIDARNYLRWELGWLITGDYIGDCTTPVEVTAFITVWKTDAVSEEGKKQGAKGNQSEDNEIVIPAFGNFIYTWEQLDNDGNPTGLTGSGTGSGRTVVTFPEPGNYRVMMENDKNSSFPLEGISFFATSGDPLKLIEIQHWGKMKWVTMGFAFYDTENLQITATDIPDVSNVTDMWGAFYNSGISTVPNMGDWDVSKVEYMGEMFAGAHNFNQPIDNWDVSSVTSMDNLFKDATAFNQPLNSWNVSNVENMSGMFENAENFNQPIGSWNVSNVTDMSSMFYQAYAFNQPIGDWDVSNVNNMSRMFCFARNFDQDISGWDVSNVISINNMFWGAADFNQPVGNWDVSSLESMVGAFNYASSFNQSLEGWNLKSLKHSNSSSYDIALAYCAMDCINYSRTLRAWAANPESPAGIVLEVTGMSYSPDVSAYRDFLINDLGWTITGDTEGNCSVGTSVSVYPVFADNTSVNVYPNPARSVVTVSGLSGRSVIKLMDVTGRVLQTMSTSSPSEKINVSQLVKGVYHLVITSERGYSTTKKIVRE